MTVKKVNKYCDIIKLLDNKIFLYLAFVFCIKFLSSCKPDARNSDSETQTVMMANSKWPTTNLSVCWEFASYETERFRNAFRDKVTTAFHRTELRFNGWKACPIIGRVDMRVFIYDDPGSKINLAFQSLRASLQGPSPGHPRVRYWGKNMSGKRAGIVLSMTGENAVPFFAELLHKLSPEGRFNLLLSSGLHEFGHAIGLRHEDAHPKAVCPQFDEDIKAGDIVIGPWNKTSFMERCFYRDFDYEKGIVWPNELDIQGINTIYKK